MSRTNCNHGNRWRQMEGRFWGREEKWGRAKCGRVRGRMGGQHKWEMRNEREHEVEESGMRKMEAEAAAGVRKTQNRC